MRPHLNTVAIPFSAGAAGTSLVYILTQTTAYAPEAVLALTAAVLLLCFGIAYGLSAVEQYSRGDLA